MAATKKAAVKEKPTESKPKAASSTLTENRAAKAKPTTLTKATKATKAAVPSKSESPSKAKATKVTKVAAAATIAAPPQSDSPSKAKTKKQQDKVETNEKQVKEKKQEQPKKKSAPSSPTKPAKVDEKKTETAVKQSKPEVPASAKSSSSNGKKRTRGTESTTEANQDVDESTPKKKVAVSTPSQKKPSSKKQPSVPKPADEEKSKVKDQTGEDDQDVLSESEIIKGFSDVSGSDDDADSSDEEDQDDRDVGRIAPIQTVKLPNSKDDAVVQQRLENVKQQKKLNKTPEVPATLYVGRLPHGFYEDQLKSYFEQFGDVNRVRVSRNRKTGAPKHYAFIEFADQDVAKIVQETMNNYLIDGRLLQVREVSKDQIHPKLWIGANKKFRKVPNDRRERVRRSQPKTAEQEKAQIQSVLKRQSKRRQKLQAAGINYDFEGYTVEA